MSKFICYPKCTTCQRAKKWLDDNKIKYELRDIKLDNPTLEELTEWYKKSGLPLKRFLRGKPIIIIDNGKINYKNLKKSKLDVNDVIGLCREKGFFNLTDVAYAIFETNGNLSVLPIGKQKPTVIEDLGKPAKKASLQKFLINDGEIDESYLKILGKNNDWLFQSLKIKNKKELKNILVAFYDEKTKEFDVHYKKQPKKN